MKSFLYRAKVMHNRTEPKKHRFHYNVFLFCLDVDAIDEDFKKLSLVSRNKFNLFSFYDRDHLELTTDNRQPTTVREQLNLFLKQNGVSKDPAKILLITNLRLLGYVFNPVSFYYCYDENNQPVCAVAEVQNTFKEMKLFFLGKECLKENSFHLRTIKHFYVSPFIDHDAEFDFHLDLPTEKLNVRIDDYKENRRFFISTLTGKRKELTSVRLLGYFFRFPFITLQIIFLIHWNAFLLWMKKIRFHKKAEHPELQKDVMREYKP
ncbi:MAG TPA: DUF1365 domain-containing protein [Bacteroidia bacterium]|nr:DUF1365 domain-containing protein [Bacteroidia bacterium]